MSVLVSDVHLSYLIKKTHPVVFTWHYIRKTIFQSQLQEPLLCISLSSFEALEINLMNFKHEFALIEIRGLLISIIAIRSKFSLMKLEVFRYVDLYMYFSKVPLSFHNHNIRIE